MGAILDGRKTHQKGKLGLLALALAPPALVDVQAEALASSVPVVLELRRATAAAIAMEPYRTSPIHVRKVGPQPLPESLSKQRVHKRNGITVEVRLAFSWLQVRRRRRLQPK